MLQRRLKLFPAVSLNMSMMVGVGPFLTIPILLQFVLGPYALLGWVLGAILAICNGLVWSELSSAFPGSGGTYHFFDAIYGESRLGRALKFLFVWQFLISGPLELASGMIGFKDYAAYIWPGLKQTLCGVTWTWPWAGEPSVWTIQAGHLLAMAAMAGIVLLAYRRIEAAAKLMVVLWVGMLATVAWVILEGLFRFDPKTAFDFPSNPFEPMSPFLGLGGTLRLAMYAYLGYYQICYLGDEVVAPEKNIPRSIGISVVAVAAIYLSMNLGIFGVVPWREVVGSSSIASDFLARVHGPWAGSLVSLMVMWTAVAACFAAVLSYSRVPYAAAKAGHFFKALAVTHPTGDFPHRSLLLLGAIAILACLCDLSIVIDALLTSRILIQFLAQVASVVYIRRRPDLAARLPFRMWLYPLPALVAAVGWIWIFASSPPAVILFGLGTMALGLLAFAVRDRGVPSGPAIV